MSVFIEMKSVSHLAVTCPLLVMLVLRVRPEPHCSVCLEVLVTSKSGNRGMIAKLPSHNVTLDGIGGITEDPEAMYQY